MTRYGASPLIFKQNVAPDSTSDYVPTPGDLWMDLSSSPPVTKKCTAIYPFVWVSIEGGGSTLNFSDEEVPSGLINGSNTAFTLANSPNPAASLLLVLNGVIQQQGVGKDYTLSGANITFVSAPASGGVLLAWYRF